MKLLFPTVAVSSVFGYCNRYVSNTAFGVHKKTLASSTSTTIHPLQSSATDDAFSAFADSLEEEPGSDSFKSLETTWQAKLEDLLNPNTNLAERQILLSELMNSNEAIQESVLDALANRKVRLGKPL